MTERHTWIGDDHPPGWRWVGTIDLADPADVNWACDRCLKIGPDYDGMSGSVAEPCAADVYERITPFVLIGKEVRHD